MKITKDVVIGAFLALVLLALVGLVGWMFYETEKAEKQMLIAQGVRQGMCGQMWWSIETNDYKPEVENIYRSNYAANCAEHSQQLSGKD